MANPKFVTDARNHFSRILSINPMGQTVTVIRPSVTTSNFGRELSATSTDSGTVAIVIEQITAKDKKIIDQGIVQEGDARAWFPYQIDSTLGQIQEFDIVKDTSTNSEAWEVTRVTDREQLGSDTVHVEVLMKRRPGEEV